MFCGITNDLSGSENHLIQCSKELPELQLPYLNEEDDNPFQFSEKVAKQKKVAWMKRMKATKRKKVTKRNYIDTNYDRVIYYISVKVQV